MLITSYTNVHVVNPWYVYREREAHNQVSQDIH